MMPKSVIYEKDYIKMEENKIQVIAFYLPQYYPTPENNKWFGTGFTEWMNVGNAKPLFKGHYQPKVPSDLGYYDLRIPEVREEQANLAKEAGIAAFCYYHYWFGNNKEMLDMPLKEVIRLGKPDFPFCVAWANHSWYKKTWDPSRNLLDKKPLIKQEYPGEKDIDEHFHSLLPIFKDSRYYKVKGKLLFVLYRIEDIPNLVCFQKRWEELAIKNSLPGFYFVSYADDYYRLDMSQHEKCESTILFLKSELDALGKNFRIRKMNRFLRSYLAKISNVPFNVFEYKNILHKLSHPIFKERRIYPVLLPNWDNTPRRGSGGLILQNSTPELFKKHTEQIFSMIKDKPVEDRIVFLKSWNEWGEGNYMEPDLKYGKGFIKALKEVIENE
jgi:hypothetical protein